MVFDTRYSIYARLVDKTKRHEECSLITITLKLSSKKLSTFLIRSYKDSPLLRKIKAVTMNFGPNHPAAHGILKLIMQFQGEILQRLDPQFGFLHRGTEKLSEYRNYLQILPYFDRFDYVANLFQEHAFCLAAEELNSYSKPVTFEFCLTQIRTLFDELSRLLNHLLTMSATCLDLGSMGPIF